MSEELKNSEFYEKLSKYANDFKKIEHERRKKEYNNELEEVGLYFQNNYMAGKILAENNIPVLDLNQANKDFRKIMKLDDDSELVGCYEVTKNGKKNIELVPIKKSNFYNAFYEPIWKNLSLPERLRSIEWMFQSINDKYNLGLKGISYFPSDIQSLDMSGFFCPQDSSLFINVEEVVKDSYTAFDVSGLVAHELMHARQQKMVKNLNSNNKNMDIYTISQTKLGQFDAEEFFANMNVDYATKYAIYRICKPEKTAELQALKTVRKYHNLNEEKFGKNKSVDQALDRFTKTMLYGQAKKYKKNDKICFYPTQGLLANEHKILKGQSENLIKLILLINFYKYSKQTFDELDPINQKYIEAIDDKISLCKSAFVETLELGELPNYFSKEEFKPLNIIEEKETNFSLPKWLRKEEEKYNKMQENAKNLLGTKEI